MGSDDSAYIFNLFLLYSPLNQGLKHATREVTDILDTVFTLQSIKSRIETENIEYCFIGLFPVFTLQSIKSRIETQVIVDRMRKLDRFLLYSPLNQGLKLYFQNISYHSSYSFYSTVH